MSKIEKIENPLNPLGVRTGRESFFPQGEELVFYVRPDSGERKPPRLLSEENFARRIKNRVVLAEDLRTGSVFPVLVRGVPFGMRIRTGRVMGRPGLSPEEERSAINTAGKYAAARPWIIARVAMLEKALELAEADNRYNPNRLAQIRMQSELKFWRTVKRVNEALMNWSLFDLERYGVDEDYPQVDPQAPESPYEKLVKIVAGRFPTSSLLHAASGSPLPGEITYDNQGHILVDQQPKRSIETAGGVLRYALPVTGVVVVVGQIAGCAAPINAETGGEVDPTQMKILTSTPEPSSTVVGSVQSPEPSPTVANGEQPQAPYPESAEGFILQAGGSQQEIMTALEQLAPNDVAKEIAMYEEEIRRSGLNPSDFEFVASLVPGKSWVIVPRDKNTGRFWIPAIVNQETGDQLLQSSLHIFEYLGKEIDEDFFNLVEVQNPPEFPNAEQRVIGDRSGWHIIGFFDGEELVGFLHVPSDRIILLAEPTQSQEEVQNEIEEITQILEEQGLDMRGEDARFSLTENEDGGYTLNFIEEKTGETHPIVKIVKEEGEERFQIKVERTNKPPAFFSLEEVGINEEGRFVLKDKGGRDVFIYYQEADLLKQTRDLPYVVLTTKEGEEDQGLKVEVILGDSTAIDYSKDSLKWNENFTPFWVTDPEGRSVKISTPQQLLEEYFAWVFYMLAKNQKDPAVDNSGLTLQSIREGSAVLSFNYLGNIFTWDTSRELHYVMTYDGLSSDGIYLDQFSKQRKQPTRWLEVDRNGDLWIYTWWDPWSLYQDYQIKYDPAAMNWKLGPYVTGMLLSDPRVVSGELIYSVRERSYETEHISPGFSHLLRNLLGITEEEHKDATRMRLGPTSIFNVQN